MKKKLAKKLASRKGLTLVELLAAIMILALIGVGMATGMTAATQTYERSVFSSETLVLQDTINTTLGDYLRYASGVVDDSGAVTVASEEYGTGTFVTGKGGAVFTPGAGYLYFDAGGKKALVVNSGAYTDLAVKNFVITYAPDTGVFHVTYQLQKKGGEGVAVDCQTDFRSLAVS